MTTIAETATLAHGYTMADIERFTRIAIRWARFGATALDPSDRWDYAWHAIVEALYASAVAPPATDLICAGRDAVDREGMANNRHRGRDRTTGDPTPKFSAFWRGDAPSDGFTDKLLERLALAQVLALLTDQEYEVLSAVAAHDSQEEAIAALGISRSVLQRRLASARATIKENWFAPETPCRPRATDDACRYGHSRAEWERMTPRGVRWCVLCNRSSGRRKLSRAAAA